MIESRLPSEQARPPRVVYMHVTLFMSLLFSLFSTLAWYICHQVAMPLLVAAGHLMIAHLAFRGYVR